MSETRTSSTAAADQLVSRTRWRAFEVALWLSAVAVIFLLPSKMLLFTEIAILALFAISLDLVLGYAGIVSLGHAAFFGLGAYSAGLFAKHVFGDPTLGLLVAGLASAAFGFLTSFLVLRGSDLTRLMTTLGIALMLGELANRLDSVTGGADGLTGVTMRPILGLFEFDLWGRNGYIYSLIVLFVLTMLARRIVHSPFGLSLRAIKSNPVRAAMVAVPSNKRLVTIYTVAAAYAGIAGALLTQTTGFVSLDVLAFHRSADVLLVLVLGGVGYLYGGIIGAIIFTLLRDVLSELTPQYWMFWIGLILVAIVLTGRDRLTRLGSWRPARQAGGTR
ncbi:branched-chain amino acid ABC transporter permease [Pararhizobium haloflavum]|uniref:branched-chain amino acid ABC transporter permease n=1 Tax=Pararhizobium haloflavum TaxID=2037914 RepID=UPI000C1843D9|nr:branched-chain amino acid ABC transporter permease [Pararhizobium haloflavum]